MKNKYDDIIDKDLKKFRNFKPPVARLFLPFTSLLLKLIPKSFNKDKVVVKYYNVNGVKIHIITPKELINITTPCYFFIHGGGFMFRAVRANYKKEEEIAINCKLRVVGIDYDLAPKYKYPIQIEECFNAYSYLISNCINLKIDSSKMILGGASAGASLANDTYLRIVDRDLIKPKGMIAIYPVVKSEQNTESMKKYIDSPCWNSKANKKMWEYYLGDINYISPIERINDFSVEHYYIELAEVDPLHDEGMELYESLKEKGIKNLVLNDTKATFHGYDNNIDAKITIDNLQIRNEFIMNVINDDDNIK
ncbi:MAG: alpha/beta hydrolase fold domain-containing protein [Bacilli bacterium]|nr:alpha/beta hydrolase fold domain-containing protein [Bacilli bacterium]